MSVPATGYHNRGIVIATKISNLLRSLGPTTYDEISPKVEYWIDCALTEQSVNADDLVDHLSSTIWDGHGSDADVARFLKEFRDTPNRSEQARTFVDSLCSRIFRLFVAASAEDLPAWHRNGTYKIARLAGQGFVRAASLVGQLVKYDMLDGEFVPQHLVKSLISHHYTDPDNVSKSFRAGAIYQLLVTMGDTLLQGILEPEDVQVCFEILDSEIPHRRVAGLDARKLQEFRDIHATWLEQREEGGQRNAAAVREPGGEGDEGRAGAEVTAEIETPIAFTPQDLPMTIDIGIPPSVLRGIGFHTVSRDVEPPSDASTNDRITAASSPTLSISTMSDLTPTELGDDTGEGDGGGVVTHHGTFYLEDGNVEVVCGRTIFRIHSPVVSFSSSKLRDIFFPSTLLGASMPEGCPRIVFKDSPEDFAVLLRMIYTPGFVTSHKVPEFTTFASLLRMAIKYGFSDVREALIEDLKGAYPSKWEDFVAARVLGEDVFGSPKPHPNAVLNLFLEQNIKFALPFAAYRAGLCGLRALISDNPGNVLPRVTLASVVHGMGMIRQMMTHATYGFIYKRDLGVCPDRSCVLNAGVNHTGARREALNKIFDVMPFGEREGDMLSPLSFGTLRVCVICAKRLEKIHLGCRRELAWAALPSLLGWRDWEGL